MYQPRTRMDEGALYELAESIKAQGIMQPILVRRRRGEPGRLRRYDESQGPPCDGWCCNRRVKSTAGPQ
jgi:ParB family chromosome partitioning protein